MFFASMLFQTKRVISGPSPGFGVVSIVMPFSAINVMMSRISLSISGSSAQVGSPNSMVVGFKQCYRAMATRWCWPPDN